MPDSWFVTPIDEVPTPDGSGDVDRVPMYVRDAGIGATSGSVWVAPNGTEYYIVRCYGTSAQLDDLASRSGVSSIWGDDATQAEVRDALNDRFNLSRTFEEWEKTILAGETP